jgi:hypothetical protein
VANCGLSSRRSVRFRERRLWLAARVDEAGHRDRCAIRGRFSGSAVYRSDGGVSASACSRVDFASGVCVIVKIIGRIAENQVEIQQGKNESFGMLILNLAKVKNSVELGYGRRVVEWVDPFPKRFYRELDQYSRVVADPESIQKLVEYPRFQRIWKSPQVLEIERDPQIIDDVKRGNIVGVFTNPKVVALLNDPQIRSLLNQQDLDAVLNYASASESALPTAAR